MMTRLVKILAASILIPLILAQLRDWRDPCPSSNGIGPCKCSLNETSGVKLVECESANGDVLPIAIRNFSHQDICTLAIGNSRIDYISAEALWHINAEIITIYNSVVVNFYLFYAFENMQDTLRGVVISNVFVNNWVLSSAEAFKQFRAFHISRCPDKEWNAASVITYLPNKLCDVVIHKCTIKSTEEFSFARFEHLEKIHLSNARLHSVDRSLFSQPANHLSTFDIRGNPIIALPDNMFEGMPALKTIILKETKITTLSYKTFKPVFNQLVMLQITDIDLDCDCKSAWLLKKKEMWDINSKPVQCMGPYLLKYIRLVTLTPIDMCVNCMEYIGMENTTKHAT